MSSHLGTFAQPLCGLKPCCFFARLAILLKLTSLLCGKSTFSQAESKTNICSKNLLLANTSLSLNMTWLQTQHLYCRLNHCGLVSFPKLSTAFKRNETVAGLKYEPPGGCLWSIWKQKMSEISLLLFKSSQDSVFKVRHLKTVLY